MFITRMSLPRRTFLRGVGAAIALPLLDSMVPALGSLRAAAPTRTRRLAVAYVPNGIQMEKWTPAADGASFEITPTLEPLRPFRERLLVVTGLDEPAGVSGRRRRHRRSRARVGDVPHRRAPEEDRRPRHSCRRLDGSDRRAGARQGHAADVAGAVPRFERVDRRLRGRLQLRLCQHALVAQPDDAAADGEPAARGVRAPVRRQRQHDQDRPSRTDPGRSQHPRLAHRGSAADAAAARAGRYRQARRSTSTPFATSSGGFRRPRNRSTSSCRRWIGRAAASRRRLPSMRG